MKIYVFIKFWKFSIFLMYFIKCPRVKPKLIKIYQNFFLNILDPWNIFPIFSTKFRSIWRPWKFMPPATKSFKNKNCCPTVNSAAFPGPGPKKFGTWTVYKHGYNSRNFWWVKWIFALLKMPLFNSISGPGCNDRIYHIFLIKMKIIRFL